MASNTIKTRIQLKNDTETNWNQATNFIPRQGEIIIYSADNTHPFSRLKVGDGSTTVINLPFLHAGVMTINSQNPNNNGNFDITPTTIGLNTPLDLVGVLSTGTGAVGITTDDYTENIPTITGISSYTPSVGDIVLDGVKGIEYICIETAMDTEQDPAVPVYKWKQLGEKAAAVYQQNIISNGNYNHSYPITVSPETSATDTTDKLLKYNYLSFNPFSNNLIIGNNNNGFINGYSIHSAISKDFADYNPDTYPKGLNYKGEARYISDNFSTYTLVDAAQDSNGELAKHGDLVYLIPEEGDDRVEGYYVFKVDETLNTSTWVFLTPRSIGQSDKLITERLLYYYEGNSNISKLGTITQGTWNGTTISVADGGTNNTAVITNGLLYGGTNNGQPQIKSAVPAWDSWLNGTIAGPQAQIQLGQIVYSSDAIPIATDEHSGVITTGNQNFIGTKTFLGTQTKFKINTTDNNIIKLLFNSTAAEDLTNNYKLTDSGEWASINVRIPSIRNEVTYNTQISFKQLQIASTEDLESPNHPIIFSPGTNYEEYFLPEVSDGLTENKNYDIRTSKSSAYNVDTATHLSSAPNNTTTFYRGDKTWSNTLTGEYITTSANGFRIKYGSYGAFLRNDGSDTYILLTNSEDQAGGWNNLRPFRINNNSGMLYSSNGQTFSGGQYFTGKTWIGRSSAGTAHADILEVRSAYSDNDHWAMCIKNEYNTNATGWGTGLKIANGSEAETGKWVGIRAYANSAYSNQTVMDFYAVGDRRMRLTTDALMPAADNTYYIGDSTTRWLALYAHRLDIVDDSANNSTDATVYVRHRSNNNWNLKLDADGYDYGLNIVTKNDAANALVTPGNIKGHAIWANQGSNGERDVGVDSSTSGQLYLFAHTTGKGLYSGSGYKASTEIITINTSGVAFYGVLSSYNSTASTDFGGLSWNNRSAASSASVNANDCPTNAWWYILRNRHTNTSNNYYTDLAIPFNDGSMYYKIVRDNAIVNNTIRNGWIQILDQLNYNNYSPTLTGGGASGTWGINVTGYSKSVLDSANNSSTTTFAYSKAGLNYGDYTWLAGWNGYELRAVNKSQFAQASHSHGEKLNQWHAGTASTNAVVVTHNSTESDSSRGQCFAFGDGNGTPWFTEIQYGSTYVRTIRLSNGLGATSFISATQFAIISTSWDGVTVCQGPSSSGAITAVATAGGNYTANGTNYRAWIEGNSVTGAVWNDYAENREAINAIPGQCVYEVGDDTLKPTEERLSHFAGIVSDTWGFSQGETETAKSPIAVAGRVLAYTYRCRDEYKPGDVLCAAPGGTVDIMTREEIQMYPDRIVGTVSCIPDYETWGGGEMADREPVEVDGRIWVKVK